MKTILRKKADKLEKQTFEQLLAEYRDVNRMKQNIKAGLLAYEETKRRGIIRR